MAIFIPDKDKGSCPRHEENRVDRNVAIFESAVHISLSFEAGLQITMLRVSVQVFGKAWEG
jgi:hypothetical protein